MLSKFTKILLSGIFILGMLSTTEVKAQVPDVPGELDISAFLRAGSADASTLMGQYLNPLFVGFGYGANGGWYNTAKTHKSLGFDLTVTVNAAQAPSSDWMFTFDESKYENTSLADPSQGDQVETLFGDQGTIGNLSATVSGTDPFGNDVSVNTEFPAPPGIDYSKLGYGSINGEDLRGYVPFVMVQAGIGLIKNTDLKVRYVPKTKSGEIEFSMFGLGLMHDFKQWIPGLKHIPLDMSILVGYNNIKTTIEIPGASDGGLAGENQSAEFTINTFTYQLLVSKKLAFLTLYGGFGYNQGSSTLKVTGTYEIPDLDPALPSVVLTDPVNEKFKSDGWKGTLGMRLKLAVITLHADYSFQRYNMFSAGLGISLR